MFRRLVAYLSEKDPAQGRFNADTAKAVKDLQDQLLLGGVLVEVTNLSSAVQTVPHKLGRVPRGCIVVYQDASQAISHSKKPDKDFFYIRSFSSVPNATFYLF